jgi:glycerol-3-phosphate dehydrogenase subunit C
VPRQNLTVRVLRQDPDGHEEPHYETYTVPKREKMSLLEVLEEIYLIDPSLTFSYSCRTGKCGSCTVRLNGTPVLACRHAVEGDGELTVEPIGSFPVYKDLLVDRDRFKERIRQSLPHHEPSRGSKHQTEGVLSESLIPYQSLTNCLGCLSCDSICPVLKAAPDRYLGPATTAVIAGPGPRLQNHQGEAIGVPVGASIEYCSFCLNCERACPYDIPFDRLNAVAKEAYFTKRGWPLHDEVLGRIGTLGKALSLVPGATRIQRSRIAKVLMEQILDFDQHIELPPFKSDDWLGQHRPSLEKGGRRVAFFVGCFARHIDPDLGRATIEVLEHNHVSVKIPQQQCCGMPFLSKGKLDNVKKMAEHNLRILHSLVEEQYDIIATCTSCSWMLKRGYPEALGLEEARDVAAKTYDLGEYLLGMRNAGELDTGFKPVNLSLAYHSPCHLKSQNIGHPFLDILMSIPNLKLNDATKDCCGLSGTYGFKRNKYDIATAVGQDLFEGIRASEALSVISECGMCRTQIAHGTGLSTSHPVNILHKAYFGEDDHLARPARN